MIGFSPPSGFKTLTGVKNWYFPVFHFNSFQFQFGAIKRKAHGHLAFSRSLFQFQFGAIIRCVAASNAPLLPHFNSNLVRLKVHVYNQKQVNLLYFNSNLVRLKESERSYAVDMFIAFQFQYGSIKSTGGQRKISAGLAFQFQYGSIKRIATCRNGY